MEERRASQHVDVVFTDRVKSDGALPRRYAAKRLGPNEERHIGSRSLLESFHLVNSVGGVSQALLIQASLHLYDCGDIVVWKNRRLGGCTIDGAVQRIVDDHVCLPRNTVKPIDY